MTQQDRAPTDRAHDPASGTAFAHAIEAAGRLAAQDGNIPSLDRIAADLGYLKVPDNVLVDVKKLDQLPDDKVVLICTGSQGEPMAALSRMANRDHRIDVGDGDTVLLTVDQEGGACHTGDRSCFDADVLL